MSSIPPRAEALEYVTSFDLFEQTGRPEEGLEYARRHIDRLLRTLEFFPPTVPDARVLELGASPYFMTLLLKRYRGVDPTTANFFGDYAQEQRGQGSVTIRSTRFDETHDFDYETFNVERDPYPYPSNQFDVVLCCEMLEHLAASPSFLCREVHRVLKPGGRFLLTTPNCKRIESTFRLLRGHNVYEPYSGYGVYGRHNREYTRWEVEQLLRCHNFEPESVSERNAYAHGAPYRLATAVWPLSRRRDNLFALARKHGVTVERYPSWLYEHPVGLQRVEKNHVEMGNGERLQLGLGWHELEIHPPPLRWTSRRATAYLLPRGDETHLEVRCRAGEEGTHGTIEVQAESAGAFRLDPAERRVLRHPIPEPALAAYREGKVPFFEVLINVEGAVGPAPRIPGAREQGPLGIAVERIELVS